MGGAGHEVVEAQGNAESHLIQAAQGEIGGGEGLLELGVLQGEERLLVGRGRTLRWAK